MKDKRYRLAGGRIALLVLVSSAWVPALIAAPRCYTSRYQIKTAGEVYDAATGLTWQQSVSTQVVNWNDAFTRCSGLGGGWRLPSLRELQTIVDDTRYSPAIDPNAFPNMPGVFYWTSTATSSGDYASVVAFDNGATGTDLTISEDYVRCVR